jgi:hypothetical protein
LGFVVKNGVKILSLACGETPRPLSSGVRKANGYRVPVASIAAVANRATNTGKFRAVVRRITQLTCKIRAHAARRNVAVDLRHHIADAQR